MAFVISMKTSFFVLGCVVLLASGASAQTVDDLLAQTAKWQADTNRTPLLTLSQMVQKAQPAQRRDLEQKFIAFLKSDAGLPGKDFVCKQLSVAGSDASVPVLIGMLNDPKTADMGRYALERIPGSAVDRALRDALPKSSGKVRIGIVNTVGIRRDAAAVPSLRTVAFGSQPAEASAALYALAHIADNAALEVLSEAQTKTAGPVRADAAEAYLQSANRLVERGNTAAALPIYRKLYATNDPATVRAAALRGLGAGGAQSTPVLLEALRGNDLRLQAVAVYALMPASSSQLIAEMPKLSEAAQVRILGLLSERGDASALPAFTAALTRTSKPVRLAALEGIGTVANASTVPGLAGIAAGDDTAEQTAARAALARIRGTDTDRAIADAIAGAQPKVKRELIRAAGERGATAAAAGLLKTARDPDNDVRRESLRALASVGGPGEISGLVALLVNPVQPDDRTEASRSLGTVLRRSDASRLEEVVAGYNSSTDLDVRAAFLRVMGQSGNPQALPPLRAALKDQDAAVKRAAIVALGEWPDTAPVPDLFETARSASDSAHQILALRSAIQLIGLPNPARPNSESAKLVSEAMSLAKEPGEKRAILALLPRYPVKETLDLATALANDPQVGTEAKAAAARLERTVRR